MKRSFFIGIAMLVCISMLAFGCDAAQTSATPTPAPTVSATPTAAPTVSPSPSDLPSPSPATAVAATAITAAAPYTGDINGDGAQETISIVETAATEAAEAKIALVVTPAEGTADQFEYSSGYNFFNSAYVADLQPGDGVYEIVFSIDVDSDDNLLYIFRYADGKLAQVLDREGSIVSVEGNVLTLNERVNVFGTWSANIAYTLDATDQLVAQPDQLYVPTVALSAVKASKDLAIELKGEDGAWTAATLEKGDEITVTGTDKAEYVYFTTADGGEGRIQVAFSSTGATQVDGADDTASFENLPYAD